MTFQVLLTDDASRDLEELYDYIESHDAPGRADGEPKASTPPETVAGGRPCRRGGRAPCRH